VWGICFFIAIATFKGYASFSYTNPVGLFITYLLFPAICAIIYSVSQLILVIRTLDDRWVIGDVLFGVAFYVVGCVLLFAFSVTICDAVSHYIDGVFFFSLCMLFTVMMVYKYWDCELWPSSQLLIPSDHKGGFGVLRWVETSCLGGERPAFACMF